MLSVGWVLSTAIAICVALLILAGLFLLFIRKSLTATNCFAAAGVLSIANMVGYLLMQEYALVVLFVISTAVSFGTVFGIDGWGKNQSKLRTRK